jgi:Ca-activated chloride channel homolog
MNTLQLSLNTDQDLIPVGVPAQRVIEIIIQAPQAGAQTSRQPLNLALVIDRSGSMSGEKLEYVKRAAEHVLDLLQSQDRAALVAYDDEVTLLAPSQPVTDANRREMVAAVRRLRAGSMTNLGEGWLTGCQEAAASAGEGLLTRALLLTDGLANVGITGLEELSQHARELSRRGISTSTFGVGHGFNEHLLEAMSNQGGGNFYYIEAPSEIPTIFRQEFRELESISLRSVQVIIQLPPQVHAEVLGGWRAEITAGVLRIDLGDLTAGRRQEVYVKVLTPPADLLQELVFKAQVSGQDESGAALSAGAQALFRCASPEEAAVEPKRQEVLERFAAVDLADAATEALKLERMGERAQASRLVRQSLQAHQAHAAPAQAARYEQMADRMEHGMSEGDRKAQHYDNYLTKKRRGSPKDSG